MGQSGPESAIKGITEEVKGKVKEAAGSVTGNDQLKREGQAQQERADSLRDVAKHEAQAEEARAEAKAAEATERANQNKD